MTSVDIVTQLSQAERAYLIAPAGYGKTHLIAQAVAQSGDGVQLILTHTHAGVHALRGKLKRFGASPKQFRVFTIASWARHCAQCYPTLSGLPPDFVPGKDGWNQVYDAGFEFLGWRVARKVLQASYAGVYVDEYQDCILRQHNLIMRLAEILPCRILGDPLQGIYGFRDPLVDWDRDIKPNFEPLPELETPWRWRVGGGDRRLGDWLVGLRNRLLEGEQIRLNSPVDWRLLDFRSRVNVPRAIAQKASGTVAVILPMRPQSYKLAKDVSQYFTAIEEMDCADLVDWCQKIESVSGGARAIRVIEFAEDCMNDVTKHLGGIKAAIKKGKEPRPQKQNRKLAAAALQAVVLSDDLSLVLPAMKAISRAVGRRKHRLELWREMERALQEYLAGEYASLVEAARVVRDRTRMLGRKIDPCVASTTLLLKGLEFDHVVVMEADVLDAHNLYVALTRATKTLTVMSSSSTLNPSH